MKRVGNLTTFDHVTRQCSTEAVHRPALFLVNFDGDWDQWFSKRSDPTETEIASCVAELNAYYRADWKDTKRLIAVKMFKQIDSGNINCL